MPTRLTPAPSSWTFTLWLTFQRDRNDAVGALARSVDADPTWPGARSIEGLEAYLQARREPQERMDALHQAWKEWEAVRGEV